LSAGKNKKKHVLPAYVLNAPTVLVVAAMVALKRAFAKVVRHDRQGQRASNIRGTHRGKRMLQKSAASQAGILFLLTLVITGVLEAVLRISNIVNQPINATLLAAGAISAALIWTRGRM
jgi:hypothetical protein